MKNILIIVALVAAIVGSLGWAAYVIFTPTPSARMRAENAAASAAIATSAAGSTSICGNGIVEAGEQCDDGNAWYGDGCTLCRIETGYTCSGSPSVCTQSTTLSACGNGIIDQGEQCDDGNAQSGDGCSAACALEPGFACTGQPTVCKKVEANASSASSAPPLHQAAPPEPTKSAVSSPSHAQVVSSSSSAPVVSNVSASSSSSFGRLSHRSINKFSESSSTGTEKVILSSSGIFTGCGDGIIVGTEQCDDGNTNAGDGCSATCTIESGYHCLGQPSQCYIQCGDGVVAGNEGCDDGNKTSGDGCNSNCQIELGYACTGSRSVCTSLTPKSSSSSSS